MNVISRLCISSMVLLCACSNSGVQGTSLFSAFAGLDGIQVLSPTALKLTWNLDSKYDEYHVYQDGGVTPVKTEKFSQTTITGLSPGTLYSFQVNGVSSGNETLAGESRSATTMTSFTGLAGSSVFIKSPTEVNLTWSLNSNLTNFKVFYKKKTATWSLTTPAASVKGTNTSTISGLTPGETYCFWVRASYDDGTFEPAASTEASLNAAAPCVQMTSQMNNLPSITVGGVVPGEFPWFWTANGDEKYKTEIYESDTDIRVASRTGNGPFRAFVKGVEGSKNYYALISYQNQITRQPVLLSFKNMMTSSKIRTMAADGDHGPLLPPLFNGGNGLQNLGSAVVKGDFNCDGLPDIAVAMKTATIVPTTTHRSETGAVVIYYSYQSKDSCFDSDNNPITCPITLVTNKAPSMTATYPDPLLITFNATQDRMHLGSTLQVGNFNGDCYERASGFERSGNCTKLFKDEALSAHGSNIPANLASIKTCDDLVIGAEDGSFYVVYGDPLAGLVAGSGASTAGADEFTCDPVSNTCRLGRFTAPTGSSFNADYATSGKYSLFGSAMGSGDYNNDGYDDLLVRGVLSSGNSDILVYRGGPQGIYPFGSPGSHAKITPPVVSPVISGGDLFGSALTSFYGSRKCLNGTPTGAVYRGANEPPTRAGYDFTRCDDVIIGAPYRASERGSIFSCKGNPSIPADLSVTAVDTGKAGGDKISDIQQIKSWSCLEHYPTVASVPGSLKHYGASVLGVKNFNGYPVSSANLHSNPSNAALEKPEISGALFVGAPDSDVTVSSVTTLGAGMLFAYYLGPYTSTTATSQASGGIQGALGSTGNHPIEAVNSVACNRINADQGFVGNTGYRCNNQVLTPSPPVAGEKFGQNIGVVPVTSSATGMESTLNFLAVSAPYRSVSRSDGSGLVSAGGSVYLYKPDISQFGVDNGITISTPVRAAGLTETPAGGGLTCTTNCTWYSSGVNPFGPSIVYPGNLADNAHFGLGGLVGGSFNGDDAGDLVATAPDLDLPSPGNGAAYVFTSNAGFGPSENAPWKTLNPNLSLEGNYQFQEAKAVGDLNGDGYEDMVTHIRANGVWSLVVYYGSANGIVKSAAPSRTPIGLQPLAVRLDSDRQFGRAFASAGDVNGDGFKDIIVFGSSTAYVFYGSSSGLVVSPDPSLAPIGKGPLKFAIKSDSDKFLGFGKIDSQMQASVSLKLQSVAVADFNNDGYDDIAIHIDDNLNMAGTPESHFQSNQTGRVLILYGSVTGPQLNRLTGTIQYNDGANHIKDVVMESPCTPATSSSPAVCSPQLLGPPHTSSTSTFGFAVAGWRRKIGPTYPQYDRLLVSDTSISSGAGAVYVYEGSITGLKTTVVQTLVPEGAPVVTATPQKFGSMIDMAGDINGDSYDDVIVSTGLGTSAYPPVYVFYGATVDNTIAFYGESALNAGDFFTPSIAFNDEFADYRQPRPQVLHPVSSPAGELFGWGIAGLGDFNNDGYNDIAVNSLNANSTANGTITGTGAVIIYFGTPNGVKSKNATISAYPRCYGGDAPLCEPFQVFLPNAVTSENTVLGPDSVGDFNGDGLIDLLVGGVGRDLNVSGQRPATSAGVLYPLY